MKLFVGNLSFGTTEFELEEAFGRFGAVAEAVIMVDRANGRSRGFGFVTMNNDSEATAAINGLHGKDLDGRPLTVNEARAREERSGGGDRGGDRGGGGGDRNRRPYSSGSGSKRY